MAIRIEDMYWLADVPADFRAICKALESDTANIGSRLRELAGTRLNANQLTSLSACIKRMQLSGVRLEPLSGFRLGVIGNATTNLFTAALPAAAARHGINLAIHEAEYDQVMQEALDPASGINAYKPDAVFLALDYHGLPFGIGHGAAAALEYLETVREGLARNSSVPVIFQTIVCPPAPLFGSFDVMAEGALRRKIMDFNEGVIMAARKRGDYVFDAQALAETVGTQNWQDPAQWNLYKLPFAQSLVPVYTDHVARLLAAIRGLARKCLVLDLDNTVWGGIIGDDGMHGIKVGQGDGTGEAHLEVQKMALALRDRGIMLAVCSKNEDATARQPFKDHPDMLLREEHITVFQANWRDKASNLEAIARTLNIGLDALVFMDDNPVERAQVRGALPMVAVPELPEDVSWYARTILNAGYFEAVTFSEEDRKRADQYRENALRAELESSARNMDEFLESLQMKLEIGPFTPFNVGRVAQLINKTNQFNLTTRRYTQPEVEAMMKDGNILTLQARLIDRFGDNGLITVGIGILKEGVCEIDTWLMSCRVLGRRVEEAMLAEFVAFAKKRGATELRGLFIPTAKNAMVEDHYRKLGFESAGGEGGETLWRLPLTAEIPQNLPFEYLNAAA